MWCPSPHCSPSEGSCLPPEAPVQALHTHTPLQPAGSPSADTHSLLQHSPDFWAHPWSPPGLSPLTPASFLPLSPPIPQQLPCAEHQPCPRCSLGGVGTKRKICSTRILSSRRLLREGRYLCRKPSDKDSSGNVLYCVVKQHEAATAVQGSARFRPVTEDGSS